MTTEYAEDFEDEYDEDIYSEIDELQDRLDEQDELAEINSQIRQLQDAHGAPFTQAQVQQIGELIDQGYTPQSVYKAVAPIHPEAQAFNNVFGETLAHVQEQQGRQLAQSEVDSLYEQASRLDDPRHVEDSAVRDMGNRKDRIAHANERIAEHDPAAETAETVEPLGEDAGPKERIAHLDALHNGAQVDTYERDTE